MRTTRKSASDWMACATLRKGALQSGHVRTVVAQREMHAKQNAWRHVVRRALSSYGERQMAHTSSTAGSSTVSVSPSSLLLSAVSAVGASGGSSAGIVDGPAPAIKLANVKSADMPSMDFITISLHPLAWALAISSGLFATRWPSSPGATGNTATSEWRHFGLYKKGGRLEAVLLDLVDVRKELPGARRGRRLDSSQSSCAGPPDWHSVENTISRDPFVGLCCRVDVQLVRFPLCFRASEEETVFA